ncbi:LysR substrate-binding domain-containing protein [Caballeronia sp. ATUFL_M2_KS44]|uniref:LysR substrate-binding domain-containing protein n=1 Tax=Caballeronia sp. ATUFL_M2_KS44 TaxID=2921767 RepID=UPI002028A362|nr:LysR substrate-binding domain-containing protein [Caballeronia sp. ATUFL_M2_KS44]
MKPASSAVKGYRRLIPSVTALVEFEAVARLASFTLAAHELGVTQAAVSRQVKYLEDRLGVRLFHRLHRSITLTEEGEALYLVVAESMQKIAGVFDRLASGPAQQELVLAATSAFSQLRLLPRLAALRAAQPDLQLRLSTQMFTADLRHKEIDAAVRFGAGSWSDGSSTLLFDEEVFPVCSRRWLETHESPVTLDALANAPLIESDSTSEGWMTWDEWFRTLGFRPAQLNFALRCTLYTDAIQASRHGQGIALGWGRLVHDFIAAGDLVRLPLASFRTRDAYYIVVPHGRTITPAIEGLIDGLRQDAPGDQ